MLLQSIYPSPDARVIKTRCIKPTKPAPQKVIRMILNTQPVKEENELIVSTFDGRIPVYNTARWPYSVHGVVFCKFDHVTYWGTGIMIGPNIVLTAGENLYDYDRARFTDLKSLLFLPGINGQLLPFGLAEVEKYYVSPNYIKEQKENYGILTLKKPIGEYTGYFGFACLEPEEIKSKRINVTGYPRDKVAAKSNIHEMWGMEGQASHVDQEKGEMHYMIDTEQGQAGSGVWYEEGENYYVCGVHTMGSYIVNYATLLTRDIYAQIYKWTHEDSNSKWLFKLESIERLEFDGFQIDNDHLSFLVEYNLGGLTTLNLFSKKIDSQGARILAKNTSWINLSMLDLYNNQIGSEGCKALAENTSWGSLSWLNLNRNNVGTEGVRALAKNSSWPNLSKLLLENNNIGPEGAVALAQNTSWINLRCLNLAGNNIEAEGAEALAKNVWWVDLSILDLYNNQIGPKGCQALAQNTSWTKLKCLKLAGNNIEAEGAEALAKNSAWKNLESLDLEETDISPEVEAEIARILAQNSKAPNENPSDRIKILW